MIRSVGNQQEVIEENIDGDEAIDLSSIGTMLSEELLRKSPVFGGSKRWPQKSTLLLSALRRKNLRCLRLLRLMVAQFKRIC